MISFLFWNLHGRPLRERVARIAATHGVDILMLAECAIAPAGLIEDLNGLGIGTYRLHWSQDQKIRLITRYPESSIVNKFTGPLGGTSIWRLRLGSRPSFLLVVVHFPSKLNWDLQDQALGATELAQDIIRIEDRHKHRRTVLVGDLNMNPFDPGVVGAHALHAVMTKELARREERDVRGRPYRFFYNPMWAIFGDRSPGPSGTFYLYSSKPGNYFWNIYDQLLLRPALMDTLQELRILESDGQESLLTTRGLPDRSKGSDHLPIFFRLEI